MSKKTEKKTPTSLMGAIAAGQPAVIVEEKKSASAVGVIRVFNVSKKIYKACADAVIKVALGVKEN